MDPVLEKYVAALVAKSVGKKPDAKAKEEFKWLEVALGLKPVHGGWS